MSTFKVGDKVEAFYNDTWAPGVVKILQVYGPDYVSVEFPSPAPVRYRNIRVLNVAHIRPLNPISGSPMDHNSGCVSATAKSEPQDCTCMMGDQEPWYGHHSKCASHVPKNTFQAYAHDVFLATLERGLRAVAPTAPQVEAPRCNISALPMASLPYSGLVSEAILQGKLKKAIISQLREWPKCVRTKKDLEIYYRCDTEGGEVRKLCAHFHCRECE